MGRAVRVCQRVGMTVSPADPGPVAEVHLTEHAAVVTLSGALDMDSAPLLHWAVEDARASGKQIVVDVAHLSFLDLPPLHELLAPLEDGRSVWIAGPLAAEPRRLLQATGTDRALRFFPHVRDALAAAAPG